MTIIALDFDGTLLNSTERHRIVLDKVLYDFGIRLNTSDLIKFKIEGYSNKDYLLNKGIVDNDKICTKWINLIEETIYLKYDKLYKDAIPFLRFCSSKKYKIVLITARINNFALHKQLKKLKIFTFFDSIFASSSKIEKAETLIKENVNIFIGDTELDKFAADIANVKFYALNRGFRSENFWNSRKQTSFSSLNEISSLL